VIKKLFVFKFTNRETTETDIACMHLSHIS
jgi:hypothetical protein